MRGNRHIQRSCGSNRTGWKALGGVALALLLATGCASATKPRKGCLKISASPSLNLYDGQPHALTVYLFPLASSMGFEQASVPDLLAGETPPGVVSKPVHLTVAPGEEKRRFEDLFPATTSQLGVVADYYRSPGDPEGTRTQVVPARCGWLRTPSLVLTSKDVYLK